MKNIRGLILILALLLPFSCLPYHKHYIKSDAIHSKARHVAVLPFVNLASYPNAGRIICDIITTELYSAPNFQIMEQTEMLEKLKISNEYDFDNILDNHAVKDLGKRLGVNTIVYGSVSEFRYKRGLDEEPIVGINVRMLDVTSGKVLWAGGKSKTGKRYMFKSGSLNDLAHKTCHELVNTLINSK